MLNQESINLIKSWEGLRLAAYKDPVGIWTIGYGHTNAAGSPSVVDGMTITKEEAERILQKDLAQYVGAVKTAVKVPLNENQLGALSSWCYNIGPGAMRGSTLIKKLNTGDYAAVPSELRKWNKVGGDKLQGLVNRREAEIKLWNTPIAIEKEKSTMDYTKLVGWLVRMVLVTGGTGSVAISDGDLQTIASAIITVIGLIWSGYKAATK